MTNDRIWILLARKLSGEASLTELEELDRLSTLFSKQEKALEDVANWWSHNATADTEFLEATYLAHLERMKDKGVDLHQDLVDAANFSEREDASISGTGFVSSFNLKRMLIAGIMIAGMAAAWVFLQPGQGPQIAVSISKPAEVATPNGARSKILLPDGTNVWLNSGSKIMYNKDLDTSSIREVYLSGEAFFDVVKNAGRPFIIHTAKMDVKVLGTRFNVKAYDDDQTTETSLIKGSVEVSLKNNPGRKYLLKPNQKLVLSNDLPVKAAKGMATVALPEVTTNLVEIKPLTYLQGTETDIESSWTKNLLSFEDEAFIDVAKKMERWYDVSIEFKNKRWEDKFLNGSFEKESLEQALKALKYTTGFNYKIDHNKITIY